MININGEEWRIALVSPLDPVLRRSNGSYTIGVCDDREKLIYIADDLPYVLLKNVLSHEIAHAAMFSYNIYMDIEQEELVVDLIATYGEEIIRTSNCIFKKIQGAY